MIGKDTKVCISISSSPGSTGALIHNSLYQRHGLDYVYIPRALSEGYLIDCIMSIRALDIVGCSVSMPFKRRIVPLLDQTEGDASAIPIVNTIRQRDGQLIGYNTDVYGVTAALQDMLDITQVIPTVVGAGATAHSVIYALSKMGTKEVHLWNRSSTDVLERFASLFGIKVYVLDDLDATYTDLLINASALGMEDEWFPMSDDTLRGYKFVLDVVNKPQTDLIERAKDLGLTVSPGKEMALYQALKQFEIYTDVTLDIPHELEYLRGVV